MVATCSCHLFRVIGSFNSIFIEFSWKQVKRIFFNLLSLPFLFIIWKLKIFHIINYALTGLFIEWILTQLIILIIYEFLDSIFAPLFSFVIVLYCTLENISFIKLCYIKADEHPSFSSLLLSNCSSVDSYSGFYLWSKSSSWKTQKRIKLQLMIHSSPQLIAIR